MTRRQQRIQAIGVALFLVLLARHASAISFTLGANTRKCLQEDVEKDALVVGEYTISLSNALRVDLEVSWL